MTIFKLIFKNLPKLEKVGLPCFQTKKGIIEKTHGFESLYIQGVLALCYFWDLEKVALAKNRISQIYIANDRSNKINST